MNYFKSQSSASTTSTKDLLGLKKLDSKLARDPVKCDLRLPTYEDVLLAEQSLKGQIHRTRILTSVTMNDKLTELAFKHQKLGPEYDGKKIELFMKCENEQKAGSFKIRGAFNSLSRLTDEQKKQGVLAYSAGNHAQGVALSARILGIKATIIMPKDSPALKIDATRGYGADIVFVDRFKEDIDAFVKQKQLETGRTFVSPFDNYHVIAGQGTVGKEILEDVPDLDHLVVCIGGGGLISGISLAVDALKPSVRIHGTEPQGGNDAEQSLLTGKIVDIPGQKTIAEGAALPHIGVLNMPIMSKHVERIVNVQDDALIENMKFFGERCKMVVEPTGCLGIAGVQKLITQGIIKPGDRVACLISGGNIDMVRYTNLLMYGTDDPDAIRKQLQFKFSEELRAGLTLSNASTSIGNKPTAERMQEISSDSMPDSSSDDEILCKEKCKPNEEIRDISFMKTKTELKTAALSEKTGDDEWSGWSYVNSLSKEDRWNARPSRAQHAKSFFSSITSLFISHSNQ